MITAHCAAVTGTTTGAAVPSANSASLSSAFMAASVTGRAMLFTAFINHAKTTGFIGRIGVIQRADRHNADNLFFIHRMIEESKSPRAIAFMLMPDGCAPRPARRLHHGQAGHPMTSFGFDFINQNCILPPIRGLRAGPAARSQLPADCAGG